MLPAFRFQPSDDADFDVCADPAPVRNPPLRKAPPPAPAQAAAPAPRLPTPRLADSAKG